MFKDISLQNESKKIVTSRAFELLVEGQVRSSKTYSILCKIHALMSKYPNSRGLILRKTKSSLAQSVLQTFEDEILGPGHYLTIDAPRRENRQSYRYKNGSELVIGGMDKPSKIMSSEYDIVYCSEGTELSEDDLQHIITRMSCNHFKRDGQDAWQQIIIDCNPTYTHHWLNQRFKKLSEKRERIFISHKCNPKFWHQEGEGEDNGHWTTHGKKYIDNLTDTLTGVQKKRLLEGEWCMGDKLVYPEFKREHIIDIDEAPEQCDSTYVGMDFGWHAGAAVVVNFKNEVAYVVETHIYAEKQITDWIKILQDIRTKYNTDFKIIADSAEPRSIEQIKNAGLPIQAVKKGADSVRIGIDLVKDRLTHKGLYLLKDCQKSHCSILQKKKKPTNLVDEFYSYEFDQNTEKPIDKNDHLCDSLRYIMLTVDQTSKFEWVITEDDYDDDDDGDMWRSL